MLTHLLFFCLDAKEKVTKEKIKAAFFWLLRHFSPLKKKNSLRSNSFFFLTLQKAPPLHGKKKRPDLDAFVGKPPTSTSEAMLSPPLEDRPLVEEREEFFALSREEEKAV